MQIDVAALKSIFNPKLRPLIGVDISSTAVKMVELVDAGKGQPRVWFGIQCTRREELKA